MADASDALNKQIAELFATHRHCLQMIAHAEGNNPTLARADTFRRRATLILGAIDSLCALRVQRAADRMAASMRPLRSDLVRAWIKLDEKGRVLALREIMESDAQRSAFLTAVSAALAGEDL